MSTGNGHGDTRWRIVGFSFLLCFVVLALLTFRALGESRRMSHSNDVQDAHIQQNLDKIEKDVRADCLFKYDIAGLPQVAMNNHQTLTPTLIQLAQDARIAFVGKGCPGTVNPRTGKPFGELPAAP